MMKLKKFFATLLAVATVASFATVSHAALDETAGFYTYETVVSPAEFEAGDAVTIEVYIKGKDGANISIGKNSSSAVKAAVKVSTDVFAIDDTTDWYSDDYYVDDISGGNAEVACSAANGVAIISLTAKANRKVFNISADEPVFSINLLASESAKAGTGYKAEVYKDNIGMLDNSTSPKTQAMSANINVVEGTFAVKGAAPAGPTATAGTTTTDGKITEYTFEGTDAIEKVLLFNEKVAGSAITEATRFKVTSGTRSQIFGGDIWAKLGAEGDGEVSVENVVFGLIVTAANNAADFTFEIVK